jgi:hypothetical protein
MNDEIDFDLTPDQWEALKALRLPAPRFQPLNHVAVEILIALRLATTTDGIPVITPRGRSVLLRGSPRLWDVAA